jgi:hypothetical protein
MLPLRPALMPAFLLTLALFVTGQFCSCSGTGLLSAEVNVRIEPPESGRRWIIVWYDSSGARRTSDAEGDSATIRLERGVFTPVLLYPAGTVTAAGDGSATDRGASARRFMSSPPAGALYPAEASADLAGSFAGETTIRADWTGGMLAECARGICVSAKEGFGAGRKIGERVNWAKCRERIAVFQDPGTFDAEKFVTAALSGEITARCVAEKKKSQLFLDIPGTGGSATAAIGKIAAGTRFAPRNPLSPAFSWPEAGPPAVSLADGHFIFFSDVGDIEGEVRDGKLLCVFFKPYVLQD